MCIWVFPPDPISAYFHLHLYFGVFRNWVASMTSGWSKASKLPTLALPSSCCGGNKQHLYFCQQMYKYISIRNYISIWNYCELDRKTNVAPTVWAIHNCILCSMVNKQRCDCGNFNNFLSADALKCFHFQLKLHLHLCKQSRRQCELVKIWRRRAVNREHRDLPQTSHQRRKTRLRALSWLPMPMMMMFSWWWILFFLIRLMMRIIMVWVKVSLKPIVVHVA